MRLHIRSLTLTCTMALAASGSCAGSHVLPAPIMRTAPQPNVEKSAPIILTQPDGRLLVLGPTVDGSLGDGLNLASNVHRMFLAVGLRTEVTCLNRTLGQSARGIGAQRSVVRVSFLSLLSPAEEADVRRIVATLPH